MKRWLKTKSVKINRQPTSLKHGIMYLSDKIDILKDVFGDDRIRIQDSTLRVGDYEFPIVDDVIILLDPSEYPDFLKEKLNPDQLQTPPPHSYSPDIQYTFGREWTQFSQILPEHERLFSGYFDLIDVDELKDKRICDLGCGMGRWSYFLHDKCKEIILVDFSEAIFEARKNLSQADNAVFFMANIKNLPFREMFADLIFSLGVLHHLPTPALDEVRALKKFAPKLLIYLYYALDNRPYYFRILLQLATGIRKLCAPIKSPSIRNIFTWLGALIFYYPFLILGFLLRPFGLSMYVPLYEGYHDCGIDQIRQDVYDRFFTGIEQRVSQKEILELKDTFSNITISEKMPYWHFVVS